MVKEDDLTEFIKVNCLLVRKDKKREVKQLTQIKVKINDFMDDLLYFFKLRDEERED